MHLSRHTHSSPTWETSDFPTFSHYVDDLLCYLFWRQPYMIVYVFGVDIRWIGALISWWPGSQVSKPAESIAVKNSTMQLWFWRSCTCVHEVFAQNLFVVCIYFLGLLNMYLAVSQFLSFSVSIPIFAGEVDECLSLFRCWRNSVRVFVGYSDSICRYPMVDLHFSMFFDDFPMKYSPE